MSNEWTKPIERKKCKRGGPWCSLMEMGLEDIENSHTKGLSQIAVTSLSSGKRRILGIACKKTPQDKGLFLNFCPWCGVNIAPPDTKAAHKKAG